MLVIKEEIKTNLVKLGYGGDDFTLSSIEKFLNEKYRFNIRDIDSFLIRGGLNDSRPALDEIPDKFFLREYSDKRSISEYTNEVLELAINLINKFG